MADIKRLKLACSRLETEDEKTPVNKNFYAVNMHGSELSSDYTIPDDIRINMFCYTGKILNICPRFDMYNWEKIFTDPNATFNYCTFLSALSGYSTLRNHFCVYEAGHVIKDMRFKTDEWFRHGVFQLPVRGAVMDWDANEVYATSKQSAEYIANKRPIELQMDSDTVISVDKRKASKLLKVSENLLFLSSNWSTPLNQTLSQIINQVKFKTGGSTILLLTCREGIPQKLLHAPRVIEEVENMYNKLKSRRDVQE